MRYVEIQRLYYHPEWYSESRNQIRLNEEAQKKVKRRAKERTVDMLPSTLPYILDQFFNGPAPPDIDTWNQNLKRWAIKADFNPFGISAKTTRKSIESWMLSSGVPPFKVYQRQGHDPETSLYHYQGLSFTDLEIDQIKKKLMKRIPRSNELHFRSIITLQNRLCHTNVELKILSVFRSCFLRTTPKLIRICLNLYIFGK